MPEQIDHRWQNGMILFWDGTQQQIDCDTDSVSRHCGGGQGDGGGGDGQGGGDGRGVGGGGEIGELQLHQLSTVFEGVEGALSIINQSHFGTRRGHRGSGSDMRRRWCKCSTLLVIHCCTIFHLAVKM